MLIGISLRCQTENVQ